MVNNIRYYRLKSKLTQEELAKILKVDKTHISKLENGKVNASTPLLVRIAAVLDVSLDELFFAKNVDSESTEDE